MEALSIGDVEKITGIKSHILRYWEENVPLLQPKKNRFGRRVYTQRDLDFIYRLDYLVNKKTYTLEGASKELLNSMMNSSEESIVFSKIRKELLSIYEIIHQEEIKQEK